MKCMTWFALAAVLAACGSKDSADTKAKEKTPASASIKVTGAVETTLSGPTIRCTVPVVDGKPAGATFAVADAEYELSIVAATDADLKAPKVLFHRVTQRQGYVLEGDAATLTLVPGKSAEIDTDLKAVTSYDPLLHVKGTITCASE